MFRASPASVEFRSKVDNLDRTVKNLQVGLYVLGGASTLLAAVGLSIFMPVVNSLSQMWEQSLKEGNMEEQLVQLNVANADINRVITWWYALGSIDKLKSQNRNLLISEIENR